MRLRNVAGVTYRSALDGLDGSHVNPLLMLSRCRALRPNDTNDTRNLGRVACLIDMKFTMEEMTTRPGEQWKWKAVRILCILYCF